MKSSRNVAFNQVMFTLIMRLVYIVGNQTMLKGKLLINCVYECRYYAYSTCTVNSM